MKIFSAIIITALFAATLAKECAKRSNTKLFCYYSKAKDINSCECSHIILPANSDIKSIDGLREKLSGAKILLTVHHFNEGLVNILKNTKVDGLEINLRKLESKGDISDFISTVRSKLGSDLYIAVSVPAKTETLAKYYDFKALSKHADSFILQTAFLGASKNVTFHPSRLSGLWDMQNTDSVVDLISGLGAPLSKVVITAPVQAFKFKLQNEEHTAPGSPALEVSSITREELCNAMKSDGVKWTLERDQDQAGPYIFSKNQWIAFDDATSMDIKAKYARVRGLAGLALKDVSQDGGDKCGGSLLEAAYNGLSKQARAPRGAVLHSLEREILDTPARPLDTIQVSPYRISRVIDVEGHVHVIRQDTRTEFECARQGYFVHPRSCGRFYRCVKFDQLSNDFNVFEFDCPAGLVFDSRYEVCVWPGSLKDGETCAGSSEIAPVPKTRFICPSEPGYYADPENCRWFFVCLDQGTAPLTAYEFRCPFGLVFDRSTAMCEWPWVVPSCGSGGALGFEYGFEHGSVDVYGGGAGYYKSGGAAATNLLRLDTYDGLGSLGTIHLGGLSGTLVQPVHKVYSTSIGVGGANFGDIHASGGFGYGSKLQGDFEYAQGNLETVHGFGSHGSTQFEGAGFGVHGGASSGFGVHGGASSEFVNTNGFEGHEIGNIQGDSQHISGSSNVDLSDSVVIDSNANQEFRSSQNGYGGFENNHGSSSYAENNIKSSGVSFGTSNGINNAVVIDSRDSLDEINVNQHQRGNVKFGHGAISEQSFVQFNTNHGNSDNTQNYYSGSVGFVESSTPSSQINIIGGGYSAVGATKSGIEITNNGETVHQPVSSTVSVPVVTSVPIPSTKSSTHFGSYNGGVVANIPELQYKIDTPVNINAFFENSGSSGIYNVSRSFGGFVSTTPTPDISVGGYEYSTPSVAFVEGAKSVSVNSVNTHTVPVVQTYTSKPAVSFVEHKVEKLQPAVVTTYQQPIIQTYTSKPSVSFVSHKVEAVQPAVAAVPLQPVVQTYTSRPAVSFVEHRQEKIQPALVQTYQQPIHNTYSQPSVSYVNHKVETVQPAVSSVPLQPVVQTFASKSAASFVEHRQENVQPAIVETYQQPIQTYSQPSVSYVNHKVETVQQPIVQTYTSKPAVSFVEHKVLQPAVPVVQTYTSKPAIAVVKHRVETVQPVVVNTYQRPTVVESYSARPVIQQTYEQAAVNVPLQPAVSYNYYNVTSHNQGYHYEKPTIRFEEGPSVTTYGFSGSSTVRPVVVEQKQQPAVFTYSTTPTPVVYEQKIQPVTYVSSTLRPQVVAQQHIETVKAPIVSSFSIRNDQSEIYSKPVVSTYSQPAISTYNYQQHNLLETGGYKYEKPAIAFEELPRVSLSTPKTAVFIKQQPVTPAVITYSTPKPVISSYNYGEVSSVRPVVLRQRPVQPVVSSYSFSSLPSSTPKPVVYVQQTQQPIVQTYATPRPVVVEQKLQPVIQKISQPAQSYSFYQKETVQNHGYEYPKPAIKFEERPVVTYTSSTVRPAVLVEEAKAYQNIERVENTYNYAQAQPEIVSSFSISSNQEQDVSAHQRPVVVENYQYNKPAETEYNYQENFNGYEYQKPSVSFEEGNVQTYENRHPVYEEPIVAKKAYVTGGARYQNQQSSVQFEENYVTSTPQVKQYVSSTTPVYYTPVTSTPRPTFASTISSVIESKLQPLRQKLRFFSYDSRLGSTPRPVIKSYSTPAPEISSTSRPIAKYSFGSYDQSYEYTPQVVTSTYAPVVKEYSAPTENPSTSRPISRYSFSSLDDEYQYISTPSPVVVSTTYRPTLQTEKYVESYVAPQVKLTTPSVYVPIPSTTAIPVEVEVTSPRRTYLPVAKTNEEYISRRPNIARVSRPKTTTIVKVNDFHPLLSAKLGAQCTCISNNLRLRKKPVQTVDYYVKPTPQIIQEDAPSYAESDENSDSVVVENYEFQPQRVAPSPTPEVYIPSTTNAVQPAPAPVYVARKRVRVRPVTSTYSYESSTPVDVFLKTKSTPEEESAKNAEIVSVVRKGLKLIKDAAKEGAKEALDNHAFDRYGPGGVRSRNEKLQGTIDCQRAGLFRHPTECNKFYACRWDCKKNRFTLHVFNCPVHLTFDNNLGACNWPSQGPACLENTILPSD